MMNKTDLNFLDRINFLGLRIWGFGLRSLGREYSWFFLFKIIFKHPIKSVKGLLAYRSFCSSIGIISPAHIYSNFSDQSFISEITRDRSSLLVATGYCQRPFKTAAQPLTCPSKRFSHACYFIENLHRKTLIPLACSICEIKSIAEAAIKAGASFHIMTSAQDIARDIFIPALDDKKFRFAILFICPYSILPITLPLFICGMKFMIIPYTIGDCRNYVDFIRADVGIKPKRTFPSRENFGLILQTLKALGQN